MEDQDWIDYQNFFANNYHEQNYNNGIQGLVMRSGHIHSEKYFNKKDHFSKVLEIGVGAGEHLEFVRHTFDEYYLTDRDEKMLELAQKKYKNKKGLKFEVQEGEKINYEDGLFDRVIAAHVLEHIYRPHLVLKEWKRIIKNDGVLTVLIPTDPGIMWRVGRTLGPRKKLLKQAIAYDYVMAREHVNSCNNLIALLKHYFPKYKESWWPLMIPSIDLNLFYIFHTRIEK